MTDAHELMDSAQATDDHVVTDNAVPGDRRLVGHHHAVPDLRIVPDMGPRHEEAVVADPCDAPAPGGPGVHRGAFSDSVARADDEARLLPLELQILGDLSDHGVLEDHRLRADFGVPRDDRMGLQLHPIAKHHLRADMREGAYLDALTQRRPVLDDGGGMDHARAPRSIMAVNSASQASWPSTLPLPRNFTIFEPERSTSISISSMSPGTTMRRNFDFSMLMK